jgi:hypothetical protein
MVWMMLGADVHDMAKAPKLPDGYVACIWCGAANQLNGPGEPPANCSQCSLDPMPGEDPTKGGKVDPQVAAKAARNRRGSVKSGRLGIHGVGRPVIGVDPGARYTGVVIRDGDAVLHASTLVRPDNVTSGTEWSLLVVAQIQQILTQFPVTTPMGVEGISDPKGFQHGKRAAINPKDIIRAAIVLGAVVATWPAAVVVEPGSNGSRHYSNYPASLIGRRPADLPGDSQSAGTRGHEQSAYDVAGKAAEVAYAAPSTPLAFS